MSRKIRKRCASFWSWAAVLCLSTHVHASGGFGLPALGGIFEGPAEPSPLGVYWNPAVLGGIQGTKLHLGFAPVFLSGTYDRYGIDPNTGTNYSRADWKGFGPLPTFAVASALGTNCCVFGIGLYTPFGTSVDYGADDAYGPQRYHLVSGQAAAFFTTPAVAVRVAPGYYVGLGVSWVHTITQASLSVDLANMLAARGVSPTVAGVGMEDPLTESFVATDLLHDNSWGWELGVYATPEEKWKLGLSYRSEVSVRAKGSARLDLPFFPPELAGLNDISGISPGAEEEIEVAQEFRWPQSVLAGASFQLDSRWSFHSTFQWVNWSRARHVGITILTAPYAQANFNVERTHGYRDAFSLAFSAARRFGKAWKGRIRLGYESSAVPDSFVNAQNLDFDTVETGLGVQYFFQNGLELGLSYIHSFFVPRDVQNSAYQPGTLNPSTSYASGSGKYEATMDKIDFSLAYRF